MIYNKYIKYSAPISQIGFGAWQLGIQSGWKNLTDSEAEKMVNKALEFGINFFDTAPNYGNGTSEERLGKALKAVDRDKIVINTKFGHTDSGKTNYSADSIRSSVEGSLRRLKMDYVDSILIHNPPLAYLNGNQNDHYEIFEKLITEGKIKGYGASLDSFEEMTMLMNTTQSTVIEAFFNILHQDAANAFAQAKAQEVAIIAKIPLDSGWLSGKYHAESVFNDIRSRWSAHDIQTRAQLVERVKEILSVNEKLSQKSIAFCLSYDAVKTVIPGNVCVEQLTSNVESANEPLSAELVKKLEEFYYNEVKPLNIPW
ncbi:MAG: aldo/keto reductase [Chitinophagaceae bacterium]